MLKRLLLFLILVCSVANADTYHWNGTISLDSLTEIVSEDTLIIDIGTVIFYENCNAEIIVKGHLDAAECYFNATTLPDCDTWRGIEFWNGSSGIIEDCIFEGAGAIPAHDWRAIEFHEAGVNDVVINGCEFRNFAKGVIFTSANGGLAQVSSCKFETILYGIQIANEADPIIVNCCFEDLEYAIYSTTTGIIDAENCWWNSTTGPTHPDNPTGTGEIIEGNVDYIPWLNNCGNDVLDTIYISYHRFCISNDLVENGIQVAIRYSGITPTTGIQLPIKWNGAPLILDTVIFDNTALSSWTGAYSVDTLNQTLLMGYVDTEGDLILSDTDTVLAWLHFEMPCDPVMAHDSIVLTFDTTTIGENQLLFGDDSYPAVGFVPNIAFDTTVVQTYRPGDVNTDCLINVLDILDYISYKFKEQPHPPCRDNALDVNGDCAVNVLDIIGLIDYKFKNGPAPVCGCAEEGGTVTYKLNPSGDLTTVTRDNRTSIGLNIDESLRAIEMTLKVLDGSTVEVTYKPDNFEVYYSQDRDIVTLGLLDFEGDEIIDSKAKLILAFNGSVEIVDALGADEQIAPVLFNIVNKGEVTENLPTEFALLQNYPNPFNPETQIEFALPEATEIKLEIYNIMGQKVATVAEGPYEAGVHSVTWDATEYSSGVYFYKITAGEFKNSKKMLLVK